MMNDWFVDFGLSDLSVDEIEDLFNDLIAMKSNVLDWVYDQGFDADSDDNCPYHQGDLKDEWIRGRAWGEEEKNLS